MKSRRSDEPMSLFGGIGRGSMTRGMQQMSYQPRMGWIHSAIANTSLMTKREEQSPSHRPNEEAGKKKIQFYNKTSDETITCKKRNEERNNVAMAKEEEKRKKKNQSSPHTPFRLGECIRTAKHSTADALLSAGNTETHDSQKRSGRAGDEAGQQCQVRA
jgi:hypothetical protein